VLLAGHVVDRYLQNQRIPGIVRSPGFLTGSDRTVKQTLSSARTASSLCPALAQWK